ncbi:hypothetical protein HDU67_002034 [Dinochytrium kinnereticum]|nr:hypothetical protein HDU67_002034 [Dinochytrium kinnereticum]
MLPFTPSSLAVLGVLVAYTHTATSSKELWRPQLGMSFQYQLDSGPFTAPAWIFDGDIDNGFKPKAMLAIGKQPICYVNVGALEINGGRSDESLFPPTTIGKSYPGWPERFLDIRHPTVRNLMQARFQKNAAAGCLAIEPDNTETYLADTGFNLTLSDAIDYVEWIAKEVRGLGMSVALKNGFEILRETLGEEGVLKPIPDGSLTPSQALAKRLLESSDFAVVEGCALHLSCPIYAVHFLAVKKATFNVEYTDSLNENDGGCENNWSSAESIDKACEVMNAAGVEGFVKGCGLDGGYRPCQVYVNGVRGVTVPPGNDVKTVPGSSSSAGRRMAGSFVGVVLGVMLVIIGV